MGEVVSSLCVPPMLHADLQRIVVKRPSSPSHAMACREWVTTGRRRPSCHETASCRRRTLMDIRAPDCLLLLTSRERLKSRFANARNMSVAGQRPPDELKEGCFKTINPWQQKGAVVRPAKQHN